jgi:hypothetical protein
MAIKRKVYCICDGPCGTVLDDQDKTPEDWFYLQVFKASYLESESPVVVKMALCNDCKTKAIVALRRLGFATDTRPQVKQTIDKKASVPLGKALAIAKIIAADDESRKQRLLDSEVRTDGGDTNRD